MDWGFLSLKCETLQFRVINIPGINTIDLSLPASSSSFCGCISECTLWIWSPLKNYEAESRNLNLLLLISINDVAKAEQLYPSKRRWKWEREYRLEISERRRWETHSMLLMMTVMTVEEIPIDGQVFLFRLKYFIISVHRTILCLSASSSSSSSPRNASWAKWQRCSGKRRSWRI